MYVQFLDSIIQPERKTSSRNVTVKFIDIRTLAVAVALHNVKRKAQERRKVVT